VESRRSKSFKDCYDRLSRKEQRLVTKAYLLWRDNRNAKSLYFKPIGRGLWSARASDDLRAVCLKKDGVYLWIFVGDHGEYERRFC